jgi:hypothetical protein
MTQAMSSVDPHDVVINGAQSYSLALSGAKQVVTRYAAIHA